MLNRLKTFINPSSSIQNSKSEAQVMHGEEFEVRIESKPLTLSERQQYITSLYRFLLKREPSEKEVTDYLGTTLNELELLQSFITSQEFADKNNWETLERKEYIRYLYQFLLKREPSIEEQKNYANNQESYLSLLKSFISSQEYLSIKARASLNLDLYLGLSSYILGESEPIYPSVLLEWYRKIATYLLDQSNQTHHILTSEFQSSKELMNEPSSLSLITILTSLYQGGNYIHSFLENITRQTIFKNCQLWIIDANSPDHEYEVIKNYLDKFPDNIVYRRLDKTISIYEAWNFAINESDSFFITNANLDDCHRTDALELKSKALIEHPDIDIVYSDVYYSFMPNLPFGAIEYAGLHTHLPIANRHNLLQFNSPHNAPLWRRRIHDRIGLFNINYQSAGDLDFWLRAARSGCQFIKIPEIVTGYYHNPQGLSTRLDGSAYRELEQIKQNYQD